MRVLNEKSNRVYAAGDLINLQVLEHQHGAAILKLMDANICRFLERQPVTTMQQVIGYIYEYGSTQPARFGIFHPAFGMIGVISFGRTANPVGEAVIGYWIGASYQGCGYATRAISILLNMLQGVGVKRVLAEVFSDNLASIRVLEVNGFVLTSPHETQKKHTYSRELITNS